MRFVPPDPLDPAIPCPLGGWPKACVRLEMLPNSTPGDAVYDLAALSRRWRTGVVAAVEGFDMFAFPHQSTGEIAATWRGQRAMAATQAALAAATAPPPPLAEARP